MVLPVDIGWNDVGSWSALWDVTEQRRATATRTTATSSRSTAATRYAYARRLVALVGVDDLVVVETDDAVLVAHKDRVQEVKDVVAQLKAAGRTQADAAPRRCTGRGAATTRSTSATRFQVKRIKVKPGAHAVACRCTTTAPSTGSWSAAPRA